MTHTTKTPPEGGALVFPVAGSPRLLAVFKGVATVSTFAYSGEAEDRTGRINRKLQKLEGLLGEDGEKPKWMRWRTYERICWELEGG